MGSIVTELLDAFAEQGILIRVGNSEARSNDTNAQFATAFHAHGGPVVTGGGIALSEVMFLELLLEHAGGHCLVLGNGFGRSSVALGLMLRGRGRVLTMDACLEGLDGDLGLKLVDAIAERRRLPLEAVVGLSPRDLPAIVEGRLQGHLDVVLVDTLHTDEQQWLDYEGLRPYLSADTLVIFHDVLNWRMEASFQEIARLDGRGAAVLQRTASGMGVLYPLDAPYVSLIEAFRGEAVAPLVSPTIWEDRYSFFVQAYGDMHEPEISRKYLERGLRETAHPEKIWMNLAMGHYDRQAWGECLSCLGEARRLKPAWGEPLHFEALVARAQGAPPAEVWPLLAQALGLPGATPELRMDAGFAAFDLGRLDQADALGRQVAAERPDWSMPWHLRALAARQGGAPAQAVWLLLDEAIRRQPVSPELKFDAALAALGCGRPGQAQALAAEAAAMAPDWAAARDLLARILGPQG
jgi:predicted O-methyltransferase YrrM